MVKDLKYIFKRIIIGVGIALALMVIKGTLIGNVYALDISSISTGGRAQTITNATDRITYNITGSPWANWGTGYLYFNFSISKSAGASTDHIVIPRSVSAYSGSSNYFVCDLGTVNTNNSTYVGSTYSVKCPMKMGSSGLTMVAINFNNDNTGSTFSSYNLMIEDIFTYEQISDVNTNVNVDNSGTINNDNQNTQSIINNENSNTQSIINNDNSNTDKIIESNKSCYTIDKSSVAINGKYLSSNGTESANSTFGISNYIKIFKGDTLTLLNYFPGGTFACFYQEDKSLISCSRSNAPITFVIPNNTSYFRTTIDLSRNVPQFQFCTNGNQAINNSINNQTNSINNINNSITDESGVENTELQDLFDGFEESNSPVSDLLTMPITLIQAFIDGMNSSCQPINLGNLFGTSLVMPCINLENILGSSIWQLIDILFALYMAYNIGMLCITIYEDITSLRDGFDGLYVPRHVDEGYAPKHGYLG